MAAELALKHLKIVNRNEGGGSPIEPACSPHTPGHRMLHPSSLKLPVVVAGAEPGCRTFCLRTRKAFQLQEPHEPCKPHSAR